jgi:hypothetical protein
MCRPALTVLHRFLFDLFWYPYPSTYLTYQTHYYAVKAASCTLGRTVGASSCQAKPTLANTAKASDRDDSTSAGKVSESDWADMDKTVEASKEVPYIPRESWYEFAHYST